MSYECSLLSKGSRAGTKGNPTANVQWVMKENEAGKGGIPVDFRGLVILDPTGDLTGVVDLLLKV